MCMSPSTKCHLFGYFDVNREETGITFNAGLLLFPLLKRKEPTHQGREFSVIFIYLLVCFLIYFMPNVSRERDLIVP